MDVPIINYNKCIKGKYSKFCLKKALAIENNNCGAKVTEIKINFAMILENSIKV